MAAATRMPVLSKTKVFTSELPPCAGNSLPFSRKLTAAALRRIRGRAFDRATYARGEAAGRGVLMWLYVGIAVVIIGGVAAFLASK